MAYKVIILYRLYMPSYFLGTFTEYPFFVSAKKIGQVLTSLSQNLPVSLNFCILGNQVNISQR